MLMLTRKTGERICIGDGIVIIVREVRGGHVKIGVEAPPDVPVFRGELYDRIHQEQQTSDLKERPQGEGAE